MAYQHFWRACVCVLAVVCVSTPGPVWAQYNHFPLELLRPLPPGASGSGWDADSLMYRAYTGMDWTYPVVVRGGHWPYACSVSGATGVSVAPGPVTDVGPDTPTACVLTWASPSGSVTPTITVTDRDGIQVGATWTITAATTACGSTRGWCFIDAVNGNDTTGNGGSGSPWASLAKVHSTVAADSNILVFRSGTYGVTGMTMSSPGDCVRQVAWVESSRPVTWIAAPGATATINYAWSAGDADSGPCMELTGQNIWVAGLRLRNINRMGFQFIRLGRFGAGIFRVDAADLLNGLDGANAGFAMWAAQYQTPSWGDYVGWSSFVGVSDQACALKVYSTEDAVIEHNFFGASADEEAMIALKAEVPSFTVRANICDDNPTCIGGNMNGAPVGGSTYVTHGEVLHNAVLSSGGGFAEGTVTLGVSKVNAVGEIFVERNTFIGRVNVQNLVTADGPYRLTSNVLINDQGAVGSCPANISCTSVTDFARIVMTTNVAAGSGAGATDAEGRLLGSYLTSWGPSSGSPRGHMLSTPEGTPKSRIRFIRSTP